MDSNEADDLCEKLFKLVERGPGKDPNALREALASVRTLKRSAPPYASEKLAGIEEAFMRWFSAKWRSDLDGDSEGQHLRHILISYITAIRRAWKQPPAPSK
jgi:hypothetical protein